LAIFGTSDRPRAGSLFYDEPGDCPLPFDQSPIIARTRSFTVSFSPAEIERAVLAWADGLGWRRQGPTLIFAPGRSLVTPLQLDVTLDEDEGHTTLCFTASLPIMRVSEGEPALAAPFLEKVAAAFADGVSDELRLQAAHTGPGYTAIRRSRSQLFRLERWRRRLLWPLVAVGPVAFLVILPSRGLNHYPPVAWGTVIWPAAALVTHMYLRWWMLGAKYKWLLGASLLLWLGVAIAAGFAVWG
jgi:hypothetical protein